jgi:glycosyl transferase family 25
VLDPLKTFVVNLKRRPDRLRRMRAILPPELDVEFTSDWDDAPVDGLDGHAIEAAARAGYDLFPWRIESSNPWWSRPLKAGEIGCAIAHWLCWQRSAALGARRVLVLEDDVVLADDFAARLDAAWARLAALDPAWDLLYAGRNRLEPDAPFAEGFVRPGYSYCTFAYALSAAGVAKLLATRFDRALLPVDELLPALYLDHPRGDVRARYPKQLRAYALEPPLADQLEQHVVGSDTEDSPFVLVGS